jgi:hypothetical protein
LQLLSQQQSLWRVLCALAGIPARLVEGLVSWQQLLQHVDKLAADAFPETQAETQTGA